jgi:hypothetical protein
VTYEEADAFASAHEMVCFETSAKTGANVLGMFQAFANWMDEKILEGDSDPPGSAGGVGGGETITLYEDDGSEVSSKPNKSCC